MSKQKIFAVLCTALLALPTMAKDYMFETVEGD